VLLQTLLKDKASHQPFILSRLPREIPSIISTPLWQRPGLARALRAPRCWWIARSELPDQILRVLSRQQVRTNGRRLAASNSKTAVSLVWKAHSLQTRSQPQAPHLYLMAAQHGQSGLRTADLSWCQTTRSTMARSGPEAPHLLRLHPRLLDAERTLRSNRKARVQPPPPCLQQATPISRRWPRHLALLTRHHRFRYSSKATGVPKPLQQMAAKK